VAIADAGFASLLQQIKALRAHVTVVTQLRVSLFVVLGSLRPHSSTSVSTEINSIGLLCIENEPAPDARTRAVKLT